VQRATRVCVFGSGAIFGRAFLCGFCLLVVLCGCGGGSGSKPGTNSGATGGAPSITVSPASANVQPNQTLQFTATGPDGETAQVFWSAIGTGDGIFGFGTISSSGLYMAPSGAPNPNTVTIQAVNVFNESISGSASAVIGSAPYHITGIKLSPNVPSVKTVQTQQFTATLEGTGAVGSAVRWVVDSAPLGGTISSTGLYTAPETVPPFSPTVQAISVVDGSISATTEVNVVMGPPVIKQLIPATANAGDPMQVQGENLFGPGVSATVFFQGPNGVSLPVVIDQELASATQLNITVPLSSVSGPVFVQAQGPGGSPQTSNGVAFTRLPRVRVRAAERDLSQGETTSFQSRIFAGTGSEALSWTADVGSVTNGGTYSAPATITSDSFAVVTACIAATQICDQERLGLHPFRVTPDVPIVGLGGTIQLQAVQGGNVVNAAWQLNGPGSLQPNGSYTASTQPVDGGGIPIVATFGGVSEQVSVAVTGGFNGLVNRISDYVDENQRPFPLGVWAVDVGIVGNRAYVLATDQIDFVLDQEYYWVDVYDLSDPAHPVWIDAFEPAIRGHFLGCNGAMYQITDNDYSQGVPFPADIAIYDASGPTPLLLSKQISPVVDTVTSSQDGCLFTKLSYDGLANAAVGKPFVVDLLNLLNGAVVHTQYTIPGLQGSLSTLTSDGSKMYISTTTNLYVFDLTTQPPAQIGDVPVQAPGLNLAVVGDLLFQTGFASYQFDSQIYDVTNPQPTYVEDLAVRNVLGSSGNQVLAGAYDAGLQLADISNPAQPLLTGTLFDFVDANYNAVLSGTHVYESEQNGGLAVYDVSAGGGMKPSYLSAMAGSHVASSPIYGQAANASTLYFAIGDPFAPGVLSFDLGTQPATNLGNFSTGSSVADAVVLAGNDLYVGTADSLRVLDVTNPSAPTQIGSVNLGILSLAVSGTSLYGGTFDGRLVTFDVTQPSSPVQVGSLALPDVAYQATVSGNLLLIADVSGGLLVYSIAVPSSPTLLSQLKPSSGVFDVAADGTLALLAAWEAGLVVVDLTNPAQPQVIGQAALGTDQPYSGISVLLNKAYCVTVMNKVAFVGVNNLDPDDLNNGQASIFGFDYTQPASPRLVYLGAQDNEFIDDGILSLRAAGTNLFAGIEDPLSLELDAAQARNVINLSFLPSSLVPPGLSKVPPGTARRGVRPAHVSLPKAEKHARSLLKNGPRD
jgi:hypothetical protein